MLTALSEPGYGDDMDKGNKDDSGGTGTRFTSSYLGTKFLVSLYLGTRY